MFTQHKLPLSTPSRRRGGRRGFALVVALGLMGFLLLLLIGLATLVQVEARRGASELAMLEARQNALFGLKMAIAKLQSEAGPDQRVTARADILTPDAANLGSGKRYWTGVWPTDSADGPVWLVSHAPGEGTPTPDPTTGWGEASPAINVVNTPTAGGTVQVAAVPIRERDRPAGSYAYWVGDEGIKAKVNLAADQNPAADGNRYSHTTPWRYGIEQMSGLEEIGAALKGESQSFELSALPRINNFPQFQLMSSAIDADAAASELFHDLTPYSLGVLSNTRSGGLRRDLTARLSSESPLSGNVWDADGTYTNSGPTWELLRRYYRLVESTRDFDPGEMPVLPLQRSHEASQAGLNPGGSPPYPVSPALSPILAWMGMTYGAFADYDVSEDPEIIAYRMFLSMKPVVVLWNPYDVAIETDVGYVVNIVAANPGSHHLAPLFQMANHYTDYYSADNNYNTYGGGSRNMHIAALLPGHHVFSKPYYSHANHNLRSEGPRFSIPPTTLLPGEVAVFTLPDGSEEPYTHLTTSDVSEELFGSDPSLAIGGPQLERGFRPAPYVWVPIHGGPIGSSGNAFGINTLWRGTRADLGKIEFNVNGGPGLEEPMPVTIYHSSLPYGPDEGIVPLGEFTPTGETRLTFNPGSSGRFTVHLHHGQLFFNTGANQSLGERHKLLAAFAIRKDGAPGFTRDFATAATFEHFFFNGPVDFSSWAVALTTPLLEELHSTKILGHFNIRALHSAGLPGGDWLEPHRMSGNSPLYIFINEGGENISPLDPLSGGEGESLFTTETVRPIEYTVDGDTEERFIGPILFHVPRHELVSLGQLMHLDMSRNIWSPAYVFGNSKPSPFIAPATISETHNGLTLHDQSYLANLALWDDYFLSTVRNFPGPAINPRLHYFDPATAADYDGDPELAAAATMLIDGPFNINSTSVEAWKSVLAGLNNSTLTFGALNEGTPQVTEQQMDSPFPRSAYHTLFGATRLKEEDAEDWQLEFETWNSIPELMPEQIEALAERIVFELRSQGGPFRSIAGFVNRNPDFSGTPSSGYGRDPRTSGVLQRALDADYGLALDLLDGVPLASTEINPRGTAVDQVSVGAPRIYNINYSNNDAAQGLLAEGAPGYLMQGDILQALGPFLAARSDTFLIRAYGETPDEPLGQRRGRPARALCEAIVQRTPEWIDSTTPTETQPATETINALLGRRFRVVAFRWLTTEDI